MVLWKKESTSADACYINLLSETTLNHLEYQTMKLTLETSKKDNEKSIELRMRGNQQFIARKWREAMESYNQSIRYALNGSESISLSYVNRSACFLHMKMYDKCLIDIELAKAANFPQRLVPKLDEREATCLKMMEEKVQHKEIKEAALSYEPNKHFPSLANVVEIQNNDEFGKHIVATRDIDVGQIIMLEDAFIYKADQKYQTCCKTCLETTTNFIPCRNCTKVMFCGVKCMESNTIHKMMCCISLKQIYKMSSLTVESILLAVTAFPNAESLMEFVENALVTRDFDTPKCDTEAQAKYRMFLKLFALPKQLNEMKLILMYKKLLEIPKIQQYFQSDKRTKHFLMHLIWQHYCIIQTNSIVFEIDDNVSADGQNIWMVANFFSLFNHSCYPNVLHQFQRNQMFICTMRPIKMGEQLFIKYIETSNKDDLWTGFEFQCKCSKCIPCWKHKDYSQIQLDPDFLIINRIRSRDLKETKQRSVLKSKIFRFLKEYGHRPWSIEIEEVMKKFEHLMMVEYLG